MREFLSSDTAQIVIGLAGVGVLVAVGGYIVAKVRGDWMGHKPQTSELITNFRELKETGELSDAEYRTIKGVLAEKLERELKGSGEKR